MKLRLFFLTLFITTLSFAQNKGIISGVITDKDANNETLPFANVFVKGTKISTTTDIDGKYAISVAPGNYVIQYSFVGYEPKEVPVKVTAGAKIVMNQTLSSGAYALKDVVVTSTVNRQKETALLLEQKNAVEIKQAIGAQELSRKGVSDASVAVAKTTGVSQQEGEKNVNVRGLGDRYNSTTLNGLPLPSEDPEYKNISLKFFSTNVIKNINVNKTFNASLYGDVAGANIDISSKELESKSYFYANISSGYNSNVINTSMILPDGHNYLGIVGNKKNMPITNLNIYNFKSGFNTISINTPINSGFTIAAGKKFDFENNNSLSVFAVATSTSNYNYKEGAIKIITNSGGIDKDLKFKKYEYGITQSGLANIKYKFGSGNSLAYNTIYIHDFSESLGDYKGFSLNINDNLDTGYNSIIRRQQPNNNILFTNQLLFDYKINDKLQSNTSVAYNKIDSSEPDRKTNSYDFDNNKQEYFVATNSSSQNHRYFSNLTEKDLVGKIDFNYSINPADELVKKINFGGNFRNTDRRFDYTQINFNVASTDLYIDPNNADAVFNQSGVNNTFTMLTNRGDERNSNVFDPMYYTGKRKIYAGYTQLTYPINDKFILQVGGRFENIYQKTEWDTNISSSVNNLAIKPSLIQKSYFLPSLIAKYTLSEKNAFRLAASQTYTMPQFKETASFVYEDIAFTSIGNPYLVPSKNSNFDIKYDYYLSKNEIISLGAFYKNIKDPINRVSIQSASNLLSYVNMGNANATGLELEVRKTIFGKDEEELTTKSSLTSGLNVSYLMSNQLNLDNPNDKYTVLPTNKHDKLQGASPLLINADLNYNYSNDKRSLTSTLVLNYFYDKIYSIGTSTNENIMEKGVPTLDFVNKFDFVKNKFGVFLYVQNILNPNIKLTKDYDNNGKSDTANVGTYKKGLNTSIKFYWNL